MDNFSVWWEALATLEKIYWAIAIPFTLFFLLQLALTFFGGDIPEDAGADADIEGDDGISFQFFTLKNMVAFFTIFSWTGIACLDSGLSNGLSIAISLVAGVAMMFLMGAIFYYLGKANESGTLQMKNAIGVIGEVYMEVKANRGNIGKVQLKVQGSLRTLEAITDDEVDLKPGMVITVKDLANDILIITTNKLT
ncbi:hypothetical protein [Fulvivirga lutea]|uniref:NfeD-like C-terminal domain-containing protein n=1 Tax=Fulvivirga lutea TaxID=2810512 RepID=A0A975A1S3_9BACT|nr:hypothetical protein [Fulvivirga lutea]QSE98530.1 hypothetical protein JR347_05475 [Fulvivirga lutea]